jgi:hypothetical protein
MTLDHLRDTYDVVVVGSGGSGLMAAIEAAQLGSTVLVVERNGDIGGATATSIGSIAAAGTQLQRDSGFAGDTPESMFADTLKAIPAGGEEEYDLERTRLNIERAPATVQRLVDLGVQFAGVFPEPPHSVPRMHSVTPSARSFIERLRIALEGLGVEFQMLAELVDIGGLAGRSRTVAISDRMTGTMRTVTARRGVVLAAGVFRPVGPLGDIARRVGAAISGSHRSKEVIVDNRPIGLDVFRTVFPPYLGLDVGIWRAGGVLVNRHGQRYTNELDANRAIDTSLQTEGMGYFLFDDQLASQVATLEDDSRPGARDGWLKSGKLTFGTFPGIGWAYLEDLRKLSRHVMESHTIEGLAEQMYVPAGTLRGTIDEYNARRASDQPDALGRPNIGFGLEHAPFYAIGPIGTFGGTPLVQAAALTTTPDLRVLDESGNPLEGLFAAGGMAESNVFVGGHGGRLSHAFATGYVAGRNIASG